MYARSRPHFDDMIGGPYGFLVVFDHDDRVAEVAQPPQRPDHLHVVLRMQADARFIQYVKHAHQTGPYLRGKPYSLGLSARKRTGPAVEAQVLEADAQQEIETARDLANNLSAGEHLAPCGLDPVQFVP